MASPKMEERDQVTSNITDQDTIVVPSPRWEEIPAIIGISGKEGSGKDTCGALLKELPQFRGYQLASFASPVKKVASILTDTTMETQLSRDGKNAPVSLADCSFCQLRD